MIPEPTAEDFSRDAGRDMWQEVYMRESEKLVKECWIRRAVAAERDRGLLTLEIANLKIALTKVGG